jgi:hypothetical protein
VRSLPWAGAPWPTDSFVVEFIEFECPVYFKRVKGGRSLLGVDLGGL